MYQADFLLKGSYFVTGNILHIQGNLFDAESTLLLGSIENENSLDDIAKSCNDLAEQIAKQIEKKRNTEPLIAETHPLVNQYMIEGLGYFYNGAYQRAIPVFMKVLKINKDNYEARFWLARSYYEAGLLDNARLEFEWLSRKPASAYHDKIQIFLKEIAKAGQAY
jgi:tetratricopeptide (TPR) repeat protein